MEKQGKLFSSKELPIPEIKVIKNTYMMAGGVVQEEVIVKRWIINNLARALKN